MRDDISFTSRSLPLFGGKWDEANSYEQYTFVTWKGHSYISTTFVPAHTDIQNEDFWVFG